MPDDPSSTRDDRPLAERLNAARRRAFVGRRTEIELFRAAISAEVPSFAVLHVHGRGGIGKTALLRRLAAEAEGAGRIVLFLDGRHVEASPQGFTTSLAATLDADLDDPIAALRSIGDPVLLVDTYEQLSPLDGWVRESLLPRLPERTVVVLAGREPPLPEWRADPAWGELLRVVTLRDLAVEDARTLLDARSVQPSHHDQVLELAHGHPLALVLVAEVLRHDGAIPNSLAELPEVIDGLLERFLRHVPSDTHRQALYAAAHAGVATEALLRDTVTDSGSAEVFDWLRGLSFTEATAGGVAVHELVSDALNAELQWRDPDGWVALHTAVTHHLGKRLDTASGSQRSQAMLELLQLFRFNPVTRRFYDWHPTQQLWLETATADDHDTIVALARRYEGDASAELTRYWLRRQPEAFTAFRSAAGDVAEGFVAHLLLETPDEELDVDPVVSAIWHHVRARAPLRSGEQLRIVRFWMAHETYQGIATHHLVSARTSLDWSSTFRMAWSFVVLFDADFYEPIFSFIDFDRPPELQVELGGRTYGMFARDWRTTSRRAWEDLILDRRVNSTDHVPAQARDQQRLLVLAHDEFVEAVRDALRSHTRPAGLAGNPLLRSRVVVERADRRSPDDVLRGLLEGVIAGLSGHPSDEKMQQALELTYLRPAPNQEAAAERLGLPFSTFRRHLTAGLAHVAGRLWELELHGSDDPD